MQQTFMVIRSTRRGGFTLIEFIVASMVMSIALLGIYGIVKHAGEIERSATRAWTERDAAQAVADHLIEALEHAVNPPQGVPLLCTVEEDGTQHLTVWVMSPATDFKPVALEWRRYTWGGPTDDPDGRTLMLQTVLKAGNVPIDATVPAADVQSGAPTLWSQAIPRPVGRDVSIAMLFRPLSNPDAEWQSIWGGQLGSVLIDLHVTFGGETVRRLIAPRTSAALLP